MEVWEDDPLFPMSPRVGPKRLRPENPKTWSQAMDIPTRSGMAWLDNSAGLGLHASEKRSSKNGSQGIAVLVVTGIAQMRLELLVVLHENSR